MGIRRSLGVWGVILSAVVTSVRAQSPDPVEIYRSQQRAMELFSARQYQEALPILRRVVRANPHDPYVWRALGRAAAGLDEYDHAVDALVRARELGVFSAANMALEIARVHVAAGRHEPALDWIERSLASRRCCRVFLQTDQAFEPLRTNPRFRRLAATPADGLSRDERWRADLAFFVEEARRMHVGPDRPAFSDDFARTAEEIHHGIPGWSDARVAAELRRLSVLLDDGHTGVSTFAEGATKLPIDVYRFAEGFFVVGETGGHAPLVGRRVDAIGGVATGEVLQRVSAFIPRDNAVGIIRGAGYALTTVSFLEAVGLTDDDGAVTIAVTSSDGENETVRLRGGPMRSTPVLAAPAGVPEPPYLRRDRPFWTEAMPEIDAFYVNFNAVRDADDESLESFADRVAERLAAGDVRNLIVDVRMNGGGNTFLFNQLIRTIVHFDRDRPDNDVYVLIGRRTFSAAQNFVSIVDRFTDAVFVGEPTGSRPNFTGESSPARLPYSGLNATISTRNHQNVDWEDGRQWIAPNVFVEPTAADYFAGRDRALEVVRTLIRAPMSPN